MRNRNVILIYLAMALLAGTPGAALAQDDDATVRKDLNTVLALRGKPCGEIVELQRQAENDYLVTCKDGSRYRIFINAQDSVVVEDRK
jgi:hypothetical protein